MKMDLSKRTDTGFIRCRHCGNYAPMKIVGGYYHSLDSDRAYDYDPYYENVMQGGYQYDLLLCRACEKVTLWRFFDHPAFEDEGAKIFYPSQEIEVGFLPSRIREAYEAALKARTIDANAYSILLGRLLEVICEDRKAKGSGLHEKLKDLASKGEIPENLASIAHKIRLLRNIGTHETNEGLSEDEIPILNALIKAVLEYLYIASSLADEAEERLKKLKQKQSRNKKDGS